MLIESIGIKIGKEYMDDNIIIPITAGVMIYLIRAFF
jgi:hypothetical protein